MRRAVTETHAWCNRGKHMVEHDGFAKNQLTCRDCRREYYSRNNYKMGRTCSDCGVAIVDKSTTGRCLKCHTVSIRGQMVKTPRQRNHQGYVFLAGMWEHPNANKRGQVLEHVKVMSEILGRGLLPGENVHHINGLRDDNRPENLELWTVSQPPGQRAEDRLEWARQIIALYEGTPVDPRRRLGTMLPVRA